MIDIDVVSPRFRSHQHGHLVTKRGSFRTKAYDDYLSAVRLAVAPHVSSPLDVDHIRLEIDFVYPGRRRQPGFRVRRGMTPDLNNVAKAVEDALEGVVYPDDRAVDELVLRRYHEAGVSSHRLRIRVCELPLVSQP